MLFKGILRKFVLISMVFIGIAVCFLNEYSHRKEIKVCTDVDFVQEQFPKIKGIEDVKFYYLVKSSNREIGLQNIEFCGFIKINEDFYEKITQEYEWKETKKSKEKVPKTVLMKGEYREYDFLYNYDFSYDGKYKTDSWGGDFYLDKDRKVLYFECDW